MDFTYHIQNFSAIAYAKVVKPKQQATVAYSFIPADAFAGRPIGLTINLQYRDAAGNFFIDPVFNETVQIVEFDEGFDTETFFMYVTLGGSIILLLFLGFNFVAGDTNLSLIGTGNKKSLQGLHRISCNPANF
jgi:translocon-associated protein subunit alpha